jgi:glycine cleavage system H lipoate-binding protein
LGYTTLLMEILRRPFMVTAEKEKKKGVITGFNFLEKECVWTRARVVPNKHCDNAFDCSTCAFDKGMQKRMARESRNAGWNTKMLDLASDEQRCRHALTGRAPAIKLCARGWECGDCPFDQMLDNMIQVDHTLLGPPQYLNANGYLVPRDYYVHAGHGWARVEYGGRVRVGLDDFGNRLVGLVDKFQLPSLGARFKAGEPCFVIERDGNQVGVKAPVSGVVTAVNANLLEHPELAHSDPYGAGWVMVLDPTELRSDLREISFGAESLKFLESEVERLRSIIDGDPITGGEPLSDVFGAFKDKGWDKLVKQFI